MNWLFDQNGIEPDSVLKEYDQARAGVDALLRDVMPKADRPEVVAKVVVRAATDKRPRRRYTAGRTARQVSMLRRFVPDEMFDRTFAQAVPPAGLNGWWDGGIHYRNLLFRIDIAQSGFRRAATNP